MNTADNQNQSNAYTSFVKHFFFVFTVVIFLFGIVAEIVLPDERDSLSNNCRIFETDWEQVLPNGDKVPVDIPGKIPAEFGEVITLTTTLPQGLQNGESLCFRPIWQDVDIYIDGELRLTYSTKDSRPFGINSPMRYLFVKLSEADAGKELTYSFSSDSKYAGDMRDSYIGDELSIWVFLLESSGLHTLIAIFLLLLSLICIIVCFILKLVYKKALALNHLAWTIFFCAFWMLSEITFRQVLVKNISVLSCYAYWSLMLIPIPLMLFIDEMQEGRYRKVFFLPITYSVLITCIGTLLQVLDIAQFVQQIPFIHLGILMPIVCIIVTITIDAFRKKLGNYLFVGIGIYGMLLTAIIEMLLYYIGATLSLGTALAVGLLFLLIMAIIKTGQDLFRSEKKRQQAILAREAQAKFLANMSHEIRTPINAILGMNEMILRENDNKAVQDYAYNIQNASNMLLGLINDVLDFSKIESGQLELVEDTYSLATLIQDEMLLLNARAAGKPISTQLDIDPRLPSQCFGDELRIKQVLTNLLSNAVKYTEKGSVTLKAFFTQSDAETIQLCFSVIDTGIGIRPEDHAKLFDSFKRLELNKNRAIQGTGLGLNIAKQLVDLMQGEIIVASEYGKGSTFTIRIPQKVMNNQPLGNLEAALEQCRTKKKKTETLFTAPEATILVVDDNPINLTLMKGLLKRTQIQVDTAASGKECLELTKQKCYHLIFMDHMMPEMDGVEALHLLRADASNPNQNAFVVALTANAIAGCREMYLEYGFNDYFSKPVQADKLDDFLLEYLPKELVHQNAVSVTESQSASKATAPVTPAPSISSELLEIDQTTGLSYCGDSPELYREILSDFCEQSADFLAQLELHLQNRDWKNYAITAHSLKGTSLTIGASHFSKLCLQHELAGKEGNAEFITAEYAKYIEALKQLTNSIQSKQ